MYERTPYTRYYREQSVIKTTDVASKENTSIVKRLLKTADCYPDTIEKCFIRLEHAGSLQSAVQECFPTPALKTGCLVRLTYKSLRKRNCALGVLHDNGPSNSDVYAINYSSNSCVATVTRYLEPLFRHAVRLQEAWSVDGDNDENNSGEHGNEDCVFDVNFHIFDRQDEKDEDDGPIFVVGSSTRADKRFQTRTVIRERPSRASPLTVHDVGRFYKHQSFYGDRDGARQLQSLAVVNVRQESDFICLSGCTEYGGRYVVLHVYYVWETHLVEKFRRSLTCVAATCDTVRREDFVERVNVCDAFASRTAAYIRMLEDAKACFWKKGIDAYIRLVLDSDRDVTTYSRFVLHDLLTMDTSSDKVSLQSKIEGSRKTADGSIDVYPNSIALDCSKVVDDLDDSVSAFAAAFRKNRRSAAFYANADGANEVPMDVLMTRQRRTSDMLYQFKKERIAEMCYRAAGEMYIGVLDLYGVESGNKAKCDYVSNYAFVRSLVNESVYISSTAFHTEIYQLLNSTRTKLKKPDTVGDDESKFIPTPVVLANPGLYYEHEGKEIVEFDMDSAYPSIMDAFNVSQETTCIMRKVDYDRMEKELRSRCGSFELNRWCLVAPYEDAPEELIVVSLAPYVYKGFASIALRSLILKRRTENRIMSSFYKRLANRLCGCMAQRRSDVYALHTYAAAASLCRTIVNRTLDALRQTVRVLRVQNDGGHVQATTTRTAVNEAVCEAFADTVRGLLNRPEHDVTTEDLLLRLRTRNVNMCLVAAQNRYAVRYADGSICLKGHPEKCVPNDSVRTAVSESFVNTLEDLIKDGGEYDYKTMLDILFDLLREYRKDKGKSDNDDDDSYFIEYVVPLEGNDSVPTQYDQHCRFGDKVALWPVWRLENNSVKRSLVSKLTPHVVVDKPYVMRSLIKFWAYELCKMKCYDFNEKEFPRQFSDKAHRFSLDVYQARLSSRHN